MKDPEPDLESELLEATTGDFLKAISSRSRHAESSRRLAEVDAIRSAFQAVPEESSDRTTQKAALPEFPGFTVLEKVGQGGFGAVYRARDDKLDREVALKLLLPRSPLDDQVREHILREARTLARVRHPHVLTVHAVLEHGEQIALVTEFVEGQSLADLVGAQGPLSASEAAQIGATLCRALAAVHAAGLVHRDVKPAN